MFTGLVEELGTVAAVEDRGDAIRLSVRATHLLHDVSLGESVAVNGTCLTVAAVGTSGSSGSAASSGAVGREPRVDLMSADVMRETLVRTSLATAAPGDRVNLERALRAGGRLGGHLVQGHVDGVGTVLARTPSAHWELLEVSPPAGLGRYLVEKGSITVDGVSLTVVEAHEESFTVSLIPETLARTTLGLRQAGDPVNLEVDILAKYVEKLLIHSPQEAP